MQMLLNWLTTEGNFKRWCVDTTDGLTKETLAAEIITIYAEHGIQQTTKIKGILNEDLANGTNNIQGGILKCCKYYSHLDEVMCSRAFTTPQDTVDLTLQGVPDLFNPPPSSDGDNDLPDQTQTQEPCV
ncbi:hypothetical protein PSTG_00893 [Puccinia striiformis f. sp. tritici PST-78]|uniref:Uncharacterized protein n=1 Tax=Puccinia striiformis f. sp. tritici PST-78 TaxID=1165861 RepID=A0A0L0W330_9BASI|nr:hypothetical protein PSTG_00893 [Puccinia striiformis f. sp. tritici PST-78]